MRALFTGLMLLGLAAAISAAHAADPIVVIVNSANQQNLTEQDIKNMYSDVVTHWKNGERIKLYNLPPEDSARETFSRAIFGDSTREIMQLEHNRRITNSLKNPATTKRASLITTAVARDKSAIGYLPKDQLKDNKDVRVVLELD